MSINWLSNNPYTYVMEPRAPNASEPDFSAIGAPGGIPADWLVLWWDTSALEFYFLTNRTPDSLDWKKIVCENNFAVIAANLLATVATTGNYSDLSGTPSLATVATTGNYGDLTGIPNIPAAQVNSDWNASSGIEQILNKPSLAMIATSGSYNDLSDKPTLPAAQVNADWNAGSGLAQILNKPTIPSAQIQSDWTQSNISAVDFIKNKPPAKLFSAPTFANVTTARQLSTSQDAYVNYIFPTSMTSLLVSQSLTATLQYADDSGFTINVITVSVDVNGCSGILSLVLSGRLQVSGIIPSSKYVKVTLTNSGGATIPTTISSAQEVLL